MAVVYTTSDKVAELLQLNVFDGSSTPTKVQVETIINRKEDFIDARSGHAWRIKTITKEYLTPATRYKLGTGIRFKLRHRNITTLASGTDKLEVWDGTNWVDWVATRTQGRGNDFWANETEGAVYLNTRQIFEDSVRATYRYGESSVSGVVEEIATKLAAIDVLTMYDPLTNFTEDGGTVNMSKEQKVNQWKEDVKNQMSEILEFVTF